MKRLRKKNNKQTVFKKQVIAMRNFVAQLTGELWQSGRHGTARSYNSTINSLIQFTKNESINFETLTPSFLKQYECTLVEQGCKRNTISLYMRMLRSICNQATRRGVAQLPLGLFDHVFTGTDSTEKRAVTPFSIRQLRELDLSDSATLEMSRDIFLLSFYLRGIPFVDVIRLRKIDLSRGVLRYRRSKTGRLLTVVVEPCAQEIFRKYADRVKQSPYLLPVITQEGDEGYKQYQNALKRYNLHLRKLSAMLGLKVKLTSYVARHSWATAAYREGVPVAVISESLGHASEKVTYTYLASFDNRTLRKANQKVLALVTGIYPKTAISKKRNNKWRPVGVE